MSTRDPATLVFGANGYLGSNMDEAANANIMINLNSKVDNAMSADPRA